MGAEVGSGSHFQVAGSTCCVQSSSQLWGAGFRAENASLDPWISESRSLAGRVYHLCPTRVVLSLGMAARSDVATCMP